MVDLDLKDRKILYELDLNCRQSNTQIGKKVGLSRKVVEYRINRMEEENIIAGYWTAINTYRLGYYVFRIYINFIDASRTAKNQIIHYFSNQRNVWAVVEVQGPMDLDVILWVDDIYAFNQFWEKTLDKYGNYFSDANLSMLNEVTCCKKTYILLDEKSSEDRLFYTTGCKDTSVKIDNIDYRILDEIALNGRMPLIELAEKIGVSSQSVHYRTKKLLENDVIKAFRVAINLSKLGLQSCAVDIYLKEHKKKRKIMEYLKKNPYMENSMDLTIGWSDLTLEFMLPNINKLTEIMEDVETKFPDAIRKSEFWISTTVHKERWLPEMDFE